MCRFRFIATSVFTYFVLFLNLNSFAGTEPLVPTFVNPIPLDTVTSKFTAVGTNIQSFLSTHHNSTNLDGLAWYNYMLTVPDGSDLLISKNPNGTIQNANFAVRTTLNFNYIYYKNHFNYYQNLMASPKPTSLTNSQWSQLKTNAANLSQKQVSGFRFVKVPAAITGSVDKCYFVPVTYNKIGIKENSAKVWVSQNKLKLIEASTASDPNYSIRNNVSCADSKNSLVLEEVVNRYKAKTADLWSNSMINSIAPASSDFTEAERTILKNQITTFKTNYSKFLGVMVLPYLVFSSQSEIDQSLNSISPSVAFFKPFIHLKIFNDAYGFYTEAKPCDPDDDTSDCGKITPVITEENPNAPATKGWRKLKECLYHDLICMGENLGLDLGALGACMLAVEGAAAGITIGTVGLGLVAVGAVIVAGAVLGKSMGYL